MKLTDRFDKLAELKQAERDAKALHDAASAERKDYEQSLYALARDEGCFGIRTPKGHYSLKVTEYGTINDFEAFEDWVKEQGLEAEFLKVEEQAARVNELVRAALETDTPLPPGVAYYTREYISHTSSKETT
jgi:hypothetical protein